MHLEQATAAQREAITSDATDITAIAGPGAGKTATLVARIRRLILDGIEPAKIAVLSFTNAAAQEFEHRLLDRKKEDMELDSSAEEPEPDKLGFAGTLHSFALRMLKQHGGPFGYGDRVAIISPESAQDLLASKAKTLGCKEPLKTLLQLKAEHHNRPAKFELPSVVVSSYLDDMRAAGIVDYDVLLQELDRLLNEESFAYAIEQQFSHLFVDEVQDSAPIDWRIYKGLPMRWKFFVGDPDQAIFGFRGGRVREMIEHAKASHVVRLEDNFRSRAEITDCAQRLIERNRTRLPKATVSVKGYGGTVARYDGADNEGQEVATVARLVLALTADEKTRDPYPPSFAVLARTNAIADTFRKGLPPLGVQVVAEKRSELPRDWTFTRATIELLVDPDNDALAFFYLIARLERQGATPAAARAKAHAIRKDAAAAGKSINRSVLGLEPLRIAESALAALAGAGVTRESRAIVGEKFRELPSGATTLDLALVVAEVREFVSRDVDKGGVQVLTMHGAKGREFDVVFIVGFEDEVIPGRAAHAGDDLIEEERRLAYVAITRARREVYITSSRNRLSKWGGVQGRTESRFLREIFVEI